MQFGFMPGKGTTDAIFIIRQLQEKFLEKSKKLFSAFVDLEKAFDRVPRELVRWALRKLEVDEWLVKAVMSMYYHVTTSVRTKKGNTDPFEVKVGLHQGSVLSPLLFIIVLEAVLSGHKIGLPWEILYADDLALMAASEEELKKKLNFLKNILERKGLKVNLLKTKIMVSGDGSGVQEQSGTYPCGVCGKGVGVNSIQCSLCTKWVHKKCSKISSSLASF